MQFDVFNGDADGLCALIQLRLAQPAQAQLITGVKRDIELLQRVNAQYGDHITVLDVSLAKNRNALNAVLQQGANVFYADHHQAGDIPVNPNLKTLIDTRPDTCTSLLIHQHINGLYPAWAAVGAAGDNLMEIANKMTHASGLNELQQKQINELGLCLNYNSYGNQINDLHFSPDTLYKEMAVYTSPLDFIREKPSIHQKLLTGYHADRAQALQLSPEYQTPAIAVYMLPDAAWARRVSGVFGNELASQYPRRAHAILTTNAHAGFQVSVRAPLAHKSGADELCAQFPSGGGRKSAAGINHLPKENLSRFIDAFSKQFTRQECVLNNPDIDPH